jgi:small subunit ribosomal protein S7
MPEKSEIKLYNNWSFKDIEIPDWTLERYINLTPVIIPHSCGRHNKKTFWKTKKVSIIERFINRLLAPGYMGSKIKGHKSSYHSGKKNHILRAIKDSFTLINIKTGENPIQILINAICNSAPREEVTRIAMGGISYSSAVDVAPQRRVDLGIKFLVQAIGKRTHSNIKTYAENVADELMAAANNSQQSKAVKKKDEVERIALSAR